MGKTNVFIMDWNTLLNINTRMNRNSRIFSTLLTRIVGLLLQNLTSVLSHPFLLDSDFVHCVFWRIFGGNTVSNIENNNIKEEPVYLTSYMEKEVSRDISDKIE